MFLNGFVIKHRFYSKNLKFEIFHSTVEKYREDIKRSISKSTSCAAILEGIKINLGSGKNEASLKDIGNLNAIDSYRAEVTTFDPQVSVYLMIFKVLNSKVY